MAFTGVGDSLSFANLPKGACRGVGKRNQDMEWINPTILAPELSVHLCRVLLVSCAGNAATFVPGFMIMAIGFESTGLE